MQSMDDLLNGNQEGSQSRANNLESKSNNMSTILGSSSSVASYLGFDLSTQQLKAIAIDDNLNVIHECSVHFDSELPEFRTHGGVNKHPDGRTVTGSVMMWIKALDIVLEKLRVSGLDFESVAAISGSGQQHGSVYWKKGSTETLKSLNPSRFLHDQLANSFSFRDCPIWMDSSTTKECKELEAAVGGARALADITGSRAYERFTGSQIRKLFLNRPEQYHITERISLVSSFLATVFLGNHASIDVSDGSGMNLFDIRARQWSKECLDACAPGLIDKLGEKVVPTYTILGQISPYFVERYGFSANCQIVAFTGDNPASLVGMVLQESEMAVSLGTSDTIFMSMEDAKPCLQGHVFCNPIHETSFMSMICFKNGSKTRERIRNECAEGSWQLFNELLVSTPRGNFGNIGFYFDFQEIYPLVSGDFRFNKFNAPVLRFSKEVEVRACVEGQFLRLRVHAENMGFEFKPGSKIVATGGASANPAVNQVLADVFNLPVSVQARPDSAHLGSALMARYALCRHEQSFNDLARNLNAYKLAAEPASDSHSIYVPMAHRYRELEDQINAKSNAKY